MKRSICIVLCLLFAVLLCCCSIETQVENPVVNSGDADKTDVQSGDDKNGNVPNTENTEIEVTEPTVENIKLNLYFPDKEALFLYVEPRIVEISSDRSREEAVLSELFKGPTFENLSPSVEGEDLVISVKTDENGVCTVDFRNDFVTLNTGGTSRESFAVGSIVNSLCELENVESVSITVEGRTNVEFGHIVLDSPMNAMTELVAKG